MSLDRRVIYTRNAIKEAFYKLLRNNSLEQITVKEICAEADINRATFYRNYKDMIDLYETIEKEMIQSAFPKGAAEININRLLYVIYENQEFYHEFFQSHVESAYIKEVIEEMYHKLMNSIPLIVPSDEKTFRILFQYMLHGVLGVLKEWVDNGCQDSPEEFGSILLKIMEKHFQ